MVEVLVRVSSSKALVHLLLGIGWNVRVGVEWINIVLRVTSKDGHTSERNSNDSIEVARVLSEASRGAALWPVGVAHLVIKVTLSSD